MRIHWLIEDCTELWGGVKVALEDAEWLHRTGRHEVLVISRTPAPDWLCLTVPFLVAPRFEPAEMPEADVVVAPFFNWVPAALRAREANRCKAVVHYVQGYEGYYSYFSGSVDTIRAVYQDPRSFKITISPNLTRLLDIELGIKAREIPYVVDHDVMHPAPPGERHHGRPVRVGLVGPLAIDWKDIQTGLDACSLAYQAGLELELVRASNMPPHGSEQHQPFPVEWHQQLPPAEMGDFYRSLDVFLGSSRGKEEGFFLPAVEAMACGVPAVLTDIPCFRSYGNEQYALFVPPGDPEQMAAALVIAAKEPEVRAGMRANGLTTASRFRPEIHGAALEQALREVLSEATAPAGLVLDDDAMRPIHTGPAPVKLTPQSPDTAGLNLLREQLFQDLRKAAPAFLAAGKFDDAACMLQAASALHHECLQTIRELAWVEFQRGEPGRSLALLDDLVRQGAGDGEIHSNRGMVLFAMGDIGGAKQAFEAAIQQGADDAETNNNLGVARYRGGDKEGARCAFARALEMDPAHRDARHNMDELEAG